MHLTGYLETFHWNILLFFFLLVIPIQAVHVWKHHVYLCIMRNRASTRTRNGDYVVVDLFFMYLILFVGVLCWYLFWYAFLYVLSSFVIILTGKRESWLLCFCCLLNVVLL